MSSGVVGMLRKYMCIVCYPKPVDTYQHDKMINNVLGNVYIIRIISNIFWWLQITPQVDGKISNKNSWLMIPSE